MITKTIAKAANIILSPNLVLAVHAPAVVERLNPEAQSVQFDPDAHVKQFVILALHHEQ